MIRMWFISIIIITLLPCISICEERLNIGVSVPLTGPAASYGNDLKNVFSFLNKRLYNQKYNLIVEDDKCDPREAVNVAQKLSGHDKVKYVVGLPCSGATLSSAPIYERAKVVAFSLGGAPTVANAGDYIFRYRPGDDKAGHILSKHLIANHKKIGLLTEETDYALGTKKVLVEDSKPHGVEFVEEDFLPGTVDFKPSLLRLKNAGVEGIVILPQGEQNLALALKQLREVGVNIPVYGSLFPGSRTFLKLAGPQAEGIIFPILPAIAALPGDEARELYEEFKKEYGELNSVDYMFYTSDAAFHALDSAIGSGGDVQKFLYSNRFKGLLGEFSFDSNGDILGVNYSMHIIKNGMMVRY